MYLRNYTKMKTIGWCLKGGVAAVISLILLSLFTLVYSHSGVHITNETGATDYKWEPNQYRSIMQEGFSWFKMNADGFNNLFNLADTDHVDILLMGSSHMEAGNIPTDANVGYLLNNRDAAEYITYNIGMSGHTIYQCVSNLENAVEYYNPSSYIIIETDRIDLDDQKMEEVIEGILLRIPSHDTGMMYRIQKYIPCFLPLYRELGNWISASNNKTIEVSDSSEKNNKDTSQYEALLDRFINRIIESADGRQVIILYHPETHLADGGILEKEDPNSIEIFETVCSEHGIRFIDMYDDFRKEFEDTHQLAHGFINTEVGEGHLNETGHSLVAKRLGEVIKELDNGIE